MDLEQLEKLVIDNTVKERKWVTAGIAGLRERIFINAR